MGKILVSALAVLIIACSPAPSFAASSGECAKYSDSFDTYHPEKWQEVLLYSLAKADFAIEDGHLMLKSPKNEPCEVQVYSLFTFAGDLDVQADYNVANEAELGACRFNAGIVLQTLGDERSYKCYVAMTPSKGLFYRSRLDQFGEKSLEIFKEDPAPPKGTLRVTRQDGYIRFLALIKDQWVKIYEFKQPCTEKLRIRFKLQTGGDEGKGQTCPVQVNFDNFLVNSCSQITEE